MKELHIIQIKAIKQIKMNIFKILDTLAYHNIYEYDGFLLEDFKNINDRLNKILKQNEKL